MESLFHSTVYLMFTHTAALSVAIQGACLHFFPLIASCVITIATGTLRVEVMQCTVDFFVYPFAVSMWLVCERVTLISWIVVSISRNVMLDHN